MKNLTLTILIILQLAVIAFLFYERNETSQELRKIGGLLDEFASSRALTVESMPGADRSAVDLSSTQQMTSSVFPAQQLREIIREELAAQLGDLDLQTTKGASEQQTTPVDSEEYEIRRQAVAQSLDYWSSIGQISHADMAKLQMQIARLRDEDRRLMLGKLVRLLDAGKIDGRL